MNVVVACVLSFCAPAASSQARAAVQAPEHAAVTGSVVFTGRVLTPKGMPALGARVVTSAGGETVTGADGSFELSAEMPRDAERVEVTAERAGLVGSALVLPPALAPTTSVGLLVLAPTAGPRRAWLPFAGGEPGTSAAVLALGVFDDGNGPALYAGGEFRSAHGMRAERIVRWNGSRWSRLDEGMNDAVEALVVFDDGGGPALFAGGRFTTAGGVAANRIARWDGSSWSPLASGMNGAVHALVVFDDGGGPALYAGGEFTLAGDVAANRMARWDGSSWSALGSGMSSAGSSVNALAVFDPGDGASLYAAGSFPRAGIQLANNIARWNGSTWSRLGEGLGPEANALAVFDDGGGPALYVAGLLGAAGGMSVPGIARWDGASWAPVGGGVHDGEFRDLIVFDDGGGSALFAAGTFHYQGGQYVGRVARWDGSSWSALGGGIGGGFDFIDDQVDALALFDAGSGPALHAGGSFTSAGGGAGSGLARWDGASWSALDDRGLSGHVHGFAVFDDGAGLALYAAGPALAGGAVVNGVARKTASGWTALAGGMGPLSPSARVTDLAVFDDGGGPALYAGGNFVTAGGALAFRIARWDGTGWSEVGGGVTQGYQGIAAVRTFAVFDDGGGPALYVGGNFVRAGGVLVNHVARWDGSSWSALNDDIGWPAMTDQVHALTVFDDGTGPALYAGGEFIEAGEIEVNGIARWDGVDWSPLGSGVPSGVESLVVFDDGSGPTLYAGGLDGDIRRWDGASWSLLGSGLDGDSVHALAVFDDGGGPALYAGGSFTVAGGVAASRIARWDGASWSALGKGLDGDVQALFVHDDGGAPALFVGGEFTASPSGDSYATKWGAGSNVRRVH